MQLEQTNILLVDDHLENLLILEAILEILGENLVKARSGAEALQCLLEQDFALILLDVQMPGMDGFETAKLIREQERSRHTPIIFLTAFSTSDKLVFKGYSLGAVDYLLKPIDPEILTSKVAVFVDLFKKTAEVKRQAAQLAAVNAVRESEQKFRCLSTCLPVGVFTTDIAGNCIYTNSRCQATYNFTLGESLTVGWSRSVHPEDREQVLTDWSTWIKERGEYYSNEFRLLTPEGTVRWVHVRSSPMLSDRGELLGHVGTVEDITERKQAEEQIKASLQEKEVLLKEIHHRVKNNLQIISSLLNLQSAAIDDQQTIEILQQCENRVASMALIHEQLYQSKDLAKIDFREYIENLVANLFSSYDFHTDVIALKVNVDNLCLCFDTAIPCGLIINELVSNSLKYAFLPGIKGEICIDIYAESNNILTLVVSDDGIGFPKDLDFKNTESLGLQIVVALTNQLGGTIELNSNIGTNFKITF